MILWIVLGIVLAIFIAVPFVGYIPGLRDLTGAAPLEPDPLPLLAADTQADYIATRLAHLDESVDEWAERTGNQLPPLPTRRPVTHLPLPADTTTPGGTA